MSDNFKKTYYSTRALHNQYLNSIVNIHDLFCVCDDPFVHTTNLIFEQVKPTKFTEENKQQIKKCLGIGTEEDAAGPGDAVDGLTGEELEKLFDEGPDEETG